MLYKKGVEIIEIEECTFGFNQSIPAIKITVANNLTALLPRQKLFDIQIYKNNILPFKKEEEFWHKVDWFPPVFMNMEMINEGFKVTNLKLVIKIILTKLSFRSVLVSSSRLCIIFQISFL